METKVESDGGLEAWVECEDLAVCLRCDSLVSGADTEACRIDGHRLVSLERSPGQAVPEGEEPFDPEMALRLRESLDIARNPRNHTGTRLSAIGRILDALVSRR